MVRHNQRHVGFGICYGTHHWRSFCAKRFLGTFLRRELGTVQKANHTQRWLFYINLPFIGVAFVFVPLFLKLNFVPNHWLVQLRRVDWIGSFLFVASTTSFLIPVTWV